MATVLVLPDEVAVEVADGSTLLEAALASGLPFASACGGQGQCSTCRVLAMEGAEALGELSPAEGVLLQYGLDQGLRLACQAHPVGDAVVRRLVLDAEDERAYDQRRRSVSSDRVGHYGIVGILFVDIRHFTAFSESLLPYDIVYVLDRFFREATAIVEGHGGRMASFFGDGFLALFTPEGEDGAAAAARSAVATAMELAASVTAQQPGLTDMYGRSFGLSAGVHVGDAVVGGFGFAGGTVMTAIGDAVNFASRVEWANRLHETQILVTESVVEVLGSTLQARPRDPVELPGKSGTHVLHEVIGLSDE